jgi:hypothetical protein
MYVFSIDIPFKGSQSLSNMRFKVTAVSFLHSGVIDTESDFLLNRVSNYSRRYSKKSLMHSGVNDTGVICRAVSLTPL